MSDRDEPTIIRGRVSVQPQRIQLRRTKGWRKPEGATVVSRPSNWGNPFTIAGCIENGFATDTEQARKVCVAAFRSVLQRGAESDWYHEASADRFRWMDTHWSEIRGRDLACWCPLDEPCHADVLLELANPALVELLAEEGNDE